MSLLGIVVAFLVIGFAVYLIKLLPVDALSEKIAVAVMVFVLMIWILQSLGVLGPIEPIRIR